jgi:hypothetical protein
MLKQLNKIKTIDEFDDKYTMDDTLKSEVFEEDGTFETYGDDLTLVKRISLKDPRRVWTMIDGDDGNVWLVNGMAFVNRIQYLITKELGNEEEEYLMDKGE